MSDNGLTIERLELEIHSSAGKASKGIDSLSKALDKLSTVTNKNFSLSKISRELKEFDRVVSELSINRMQQLGKSLNYLGKVKVRGNVASELKTIGSGVKSLDSISTANIEKLVKSLEPLKNLKGISGAKKGLNALKEFPKIIKDLSKINLDDFIKDIEKLNAKVAPLSNNLNAISNISNKLPKNLNRLNKLAYQIGDNSRFSSVGLGSMWLRFKGITAAAKHTVSGLGKFITTSNEYVENLNLFEASMGEYTEEALRYAQKVEEVMGIDSSDWIRHQGVFMSIAKGFGLAGDKAALLSKNMTQLGYDLSSLMNADFDTSMKKLTAGLSGELEPLRRWGYDLSQARLKAEAAELGIKKAFTQMTQAEKVQLRYIAIMKQVNWSHGDMARTLEAPANQLRILHSQVRILSRSIGNILIPILNKVLPYAIAVVKVTRRIADIIGVLVGFKLPEFDYTGIKNGNKAVGGMSENFSKATKAAKKLQSTFSFDELNILNKKTGGVGENKPDALGGGFDFKLPEYDFLADVAKSKADELVDKWTEFLGINKEIKSWTDLIEIGWEKIKKVVGKIDLSEMWKKVNKIGVELFSWETIEKIQPIVEPIIPIIEPIIRPIIDIKGNESAQRKIEETLERLKKSLENVKKAFINTLKFIKGITVDLWKKFYDKNKEELKKKFLGQFEAFGEITEVITGLVETISEIAGVFASNEGIQIFSDLLYITIMPTIDRITVSLRIVRDILKILFKPIINNKGEIKKAFEVILKVINMLREKVKNLNRRLGGSKNSFASLSDTYEKNVKPFVDKVVEALTIVTKVSLKIFSITVAAFGYMVKNLSNFKEVLKGDWEFIKLIWDSIKEGVNKFWDALKEKSKEKFGDWNTIQKRLIATGLTGIANIAIAIVNGVLRKITRGINNTILKINTLLKAYNKVAGVIGFSQVDLIDTIVGFQIEYVQVPAYANGGYPSAGQMFIARESGAEMVGAIGNRTAVANNDQIVESISRGVYAAVTSALGGMNQNQEIRISIDGEDVAFVFEKRQKERGVSLYDGGVVYG